MENWIQAVPMPAVLIGMMTLNILALVLPANRLLTRLELSRLYLLILFVPLFGGVLFTWGIAFSDSQKPPEKVISPL